MAKIILGRRASRPRGAFGFGAAPPADADAGALIEDGSESHTLCIVPTGGGKGRSVVVPNLLRYPGSTVVIDIKGEIANVTARHRREMGQHVVIIDPWDKVDPKRKTCPTDGYNPLDVVAEGDVGDNAYQMASLLSPPLLGTAVNETYWNERAESLIAGIMAHVVTGPDTDRSLSKLYSLLHADDPAYGLAVLLDTCGDRMNRFAREQIATLLAMGDAERTRSCILSTALGFIRIFGTDTVRRATDRTSFDVGLLAAGQPITIYLVVPPEVVRSHASLVRLWLTALMNVIIRRKRRPAMPTLFVVDEFAQLGEMPQITAGITLGRSYGARFMLFVQSLAQLRSHYRIDHQTLVENCGNILTFGHTLRTMSDDVAAVLGDISPETLAGMAPDEAALKQRGSPTEIVGRLDYLTDPTFAGLFDPNPIYEADPDPSAPIVLPEAASEAEGARDGRGLAPGAAGGAGSAPATDHSPLRHGFPIAPIADIVDRHPAGRLKPDRVAWLERPPASALAMTLMEVLHPADPSGGCDADQVFHLTVFGHRGEAGEEHLCPRCLRLFYEDRAQDVLTRMAAGGQTFAAGKPKG